MTSTSAPSSAAQPHRDPRSEVRFENTRFDPDLTPFHDLAKQMAARFGYTAELSLRSASCRTAAPSRGPAQPVPVLSHPAHPGGGPTGDPGRRWSHIWRGGARVPCSRTAEKVALAYCEGLTLYDIARFAELHDELRVHFDEKEVAEIAAVIINMNVWTRLKLAQGAIPAADEALRPPSPSV